MKKETNAITIPAILSVAAIIAVAMLMAMIAGCAARTPEQTITGFFQAIDDGNYNKAASYCTTRLREETGDTDAAYQEMSESPDPELGDNPWLDEEDLVSEIEGDTARVWHKDFDVFKWILKKEGGQWKIDDVDFDMSGMLEGLQDMMPEGAEMPEGFEMPEGMEIPGN
jgi:hypothetical protein